MQITITGRHVEVTPAIRDYAQAKVEKLLRFFGRATGATVTLAVEHADHEVEMVLDLARGVRLVGKAAAPDMYAAIDLAEQKLGMQLRRTKERWRDHHRGERRTPVDATRPRPPSEDEATTYEDVIERLRRGE